MNTKYYARKACFVIALTSIFLSESVVAQGGEESAANDTAHSFFSRKNVITYGIVAHSVFTTYVEYKWWWEGNYHPFNFQVEGFLNDYALGVDKIGHTYTSHFYFHILYNVMKWGGYDESTNLWVSSLIPAVYASSIEIGDGFSSFLFSPDDLAFNLLGVGYGVLQVKLPFFNNFKIKWSYFPSASHLNTFKHPFSDDYDNHIYWLAINVHNLLPERAATHWPRFLNIAIGYGGKNISVDLLRRGPMLRKFAIALDYNITTIPIDGDTWEVVKNIVDLFHFPAPGVRFVETEPAEFKPVLLH